MTGRRSLWKSAAHRPEASRTAPPTWKYLVGPLMIGLGFVIGLRLARARRSTKTAGRWHSVSAPSEYESENADEIRLILREAGLSQDVIEAIAGGSWAATDIPPVRAPEDYHAYAAGVAGLEQLSATAQGVSATTAAQIAAALQERMVEWEKDRRVA